MNAPTDTSDWEMLQLPVLVCRHSVHCISRCHSNRHHLYLNQFPLPFFSKRGGVSAPSVISTNRDSGAVVSVSRGTEGEPISIFLDPSCPDMSESFLRWESLQSSLLRLLSNHNAADDWQDTGPRPHLRLEADSLKTGQGVLEQRLDVLQTEQSRTLQSGVDLMAAFGANANANHRLRQADAAKGKSPRKSSKPFLVNIDEAGQSKVDMFDQTIMDYTGYGDCTNPFLTSMELTLAGAASYASPPEPSLAPTNTFIMPTKEQVQPNSEFLTPFPPKCDRLMSMASTSAKPANPFTSMD
ncbi:hypothetical protein F7725_010835 [Dissostichus mawsoni]|uniref:Uncharacterized protein n=1 Tax=Dissostichus mawsoni TaxID=36200 RepID=A0A7J5Z756_DISMA|nr:hypothetical protein F7725_010835 [Dissostichus mawsoni]